ncbi:MAG: GNAT family N-acetyltransferase [Bacteroidales bacterium]
MFQKYIKLTLGNFIEFSKHISLNSKPQIDLYFDEKYLWMNSRSSFSAFNSIFNTTKDESGLEEILEKAKDYFAPKEHVYWSTNKPENIDNQYKNIFDKYGYLCGGVYTGVMKNLNTQLNTPNINPDIKIKKITQAEEYKSYIDIITIGFGLNNEVKKEFEKKLDILNEKLNLTHYLAFFNNKPCSVATSFYHNKTVGLYNAATLPEYRKKGVFTAIMNIALSNAQNKGCNYAVAQLMGKKQASGLVNTFDFEEVAYFTPYIQGGSLEP